MAVAATALNTELDASRPGPSMSNDDGTALSPTLRTTFAIQTQTIGGNARVHNGNNYFMTRRSSTFDRHRPAILKWLSPLNFEGIHERIRDESLVADQSDSSRGERYAGKWLLESETFDAWRTRKLRKLWYVGMPGAGKTVLASIIIAHLFELQESLKYNEGNPRIAYLYLSYKATHTIEQLLGSVIKQFVQDEEPLPQPLVKLWTRRNQGDDPATVKDLSELLRTLFEDRSGYIVVDALDECPPNYRLRLMKVIETQSENLSILVTSRLLDEFDEISKNFERLNIRANPSDLSLFIDHEFDTKSRLRKFSQQDRNLRDEVKEAVRNACDGMFLLASLQMQSLASELSLRGIREKLHNLPKKVEDMYKDTLDRIDKMEDNKRKLALDTLAWIVSSRRPLGINELQHVLAVLPGDSRLDFDHIYQEDDIRDVCGGMVTVTNGVVSLVHYTAQSYFNSIGSSRFPNFHSIIARTCVTYLSLTVLEQPDDEENQMSYADDLDTIPDDRSAAEFFRTHRPGLFSTQRLSFDNKRRIFPFVDYAGPALGYHLRKIPSGSESTDLVSSLIKLLQDRPKRNFFLRVLSEHNLPQPYIRQNLVALADSDKESAYSFNSVDLDDDDILNLQENTEDAQSEHEVDWILKRILEDSDFDSDSDSDAQSTSSQSSASLLGRSTGRSSPLNAEMNTSETDIEPEASSQLGQSEVGDDGEEEGSTAHDSDGEPNTSEIGVPRVVTPLHLAAYLGWKPLITKLVEMPEAVIDINTIDPWDRTPIIIAVNEGNWDVVPILLHHGASVDIMSAEYAYILLHAAQMGRRDVFENLVSQARGPLALQPQDVKFMVALLTAASDFLTFLFLFFSAVSALWNDKTGSLSKVDEEGKEKQSTPESLGNHLQLVEASVSGDVDIINHLIEDGKINFKTQHSVFHIMALFSAVEFNQPMVVQALVDAGADVNMRDFGGNAPLHRAVSRNYVEVVKVLLKAKPDVELKNDDGQTPWSSSLDREHREVLDLLRRAGADPNARGPQGISRLYQAAAAGDTDTVLFLLESGVNPSITTDYGWAPLHWAANNGQLPCVRVLIEAGANINPLSDQSTTPLDMARKTNQTVIEQVLLDAGAKTAEEIFEEKGSRSVYIGQDDDDDDSADTDSDSESSDNLWTYHTNYLSASLNELQDVVQQAESKEDLSAKQRRRVLRTVLKWLTEFEDEEGLDSLKGEEEKKLFSELKSRLTSEMEKTDPEESSKEAEDNTTIQNEKPENRIDDAAVQDEKHLDTQDSIGLESGSA